ncbi:proteoglycan 4-like [Amphibalanus amphitrite]|uniref:proteoglycan 4-like n=1 Tax=Amphibalanus amphitrite TaxID=1232801 RepID=UPI001C90EBAB|nr:proteoglycan 4-like [Amphibalanus amphitrite]
MHCLTCLVVCLLAPLVTSVHDGRLENFYYDKDMEKGMFSYGFEVEPMNKPKAQDLSTGMSFGVRHHRHDDGSQSWGYAIGSGPLPASALQESGPSVQDSARSASPSAAPSAERSVLTVRPSGPREAAHSQEQLPAVRPGLFQASGGLRPVYVRRGEPAPPQFDPLDGHLLLGSEKIQQVVPFHGDFGARLSRRLRPDESVPRWRAQLPSGGFRRRQVIRPRQPEQQQPALFPSEQQPEPEVFPSGQQEDPPVTTYRPSVRPTLAATATLEEPASAPGADQSAPSAPIHVTQVAAAAQPVSEFRGALPGPDPRFQPGPFPSGPPFPGVFPSGGGAPFGFGQQAPAFGGNFPVGPTPVFNGFPGNDFFGNVNQVPQNNRFFSNDFTGTPHPSFASGNSAQLGNNDNFRTSNQFQPNERFPEDQFDGLQQIPDVPSPTPSPLRQDDKEASPNPSSNSEVPSETNEASSPTTESQTHPDDERRRYRDGDRGRLGGTQSTTRRKRIRSGGRRPGHRRRQRPTPEPDPLLSASQTPDNADDKVFAAPESPATNDETESGAGFRRRPSKAILLTAASVYQDDAPSRQDLIRTPVGEFIDPLNGTRIVIRRRLKKVPRVSKDDTTEPSATSEGDTIAPTASEASLDDKVIDDGDIAGGDSLSFIPDRHQGPRPRVLAVGRRRHRLQPRRNDATTTETPGTDDTLKDVHPVEAPPTRRYRPRSRLEKERSQIREDDVLSGQQSEGEETPVAIGEGSDSDSVLARPPTDRISLLEQRKAARIANRRRPSNRRGFPGRNNENVEVENGPLDDNEEQGPSEASRGRRPRPLRRGRPQRGPGIVRPSRYTTPAPEIPELDVTTSSGVSDDGETPFATVAAAPTEEPARRRGASRLRRPGRPGGRRLRTNNDESEDQVEPSTSPSQPSEPTTASDQGYLPTTPSEDAYRTSSVQGYLPTTADDYPTSTSQSPGYLPTTGSGQEYGISTAQGPAYLPSTEPGVTTVPTTARPRSLMDRYKEDRLSVAQAREDWLRAQFDRNLAASKEQTSEDNLTDEDFRSLFNRRLEERLSSADAAPPTTTKAPMTVNDDAAHDSLDDAASREARIKALFAQYTKATQPPSTSTTTDPPFPQPTTLDPSSREAKLQALFAQYTKATTTADPSSTTSAADLQKLFALHVQSLGTTVPTPAVIASFKSSVNRVGATPTMSAGGGDHDGLHAVSYLPQPTTPGPLSEVTVSDDSARLGGTQQPGLDLTQVPTPPHRPSISADDGERHDQKMAQDTDPLSPIPTTYRQPTTRAPVTEPTTSRGQWTLDDILESVRPDTRFGPKQDNSVSLTEAPPTTTRKPSRRPTRRPEPARPFDGFNGIDDERHAEKLTLGSESEQESGAARGEVLLPVRSGAQSVVVSVLTVLLSSWLSFTALRLSL